MCYPALALTHSTGQKKTYFSKSRHKMQNLMTQNKGFSHACTRADINGSVSWWQRGERDPWFECSMHIRCFAPLSHHRNCSFQSARRFSSSSCLSLLPSLPRFLVSHKQPQGLEAYGVTRESSNSHYLFELQL